MKIAIIAHLFGFRDGQGRVNYEVARAALAAGHEVTMVAHECDKELADSPKARFVEIRESYIPTQFMRNWSFSARSASWLRKFGKHFDVIQANGAVTSEPVDIVAAHFVHSSWLRHPSYPFKLPSIRPYTLYQNLFTSYNASLEKPLYNRARAIIAVSRKTAREVEDLGIDPAKIHVIYNGVDTETFHPGPGDRTRFGLPPDVNLALFVGDIRTPRKNLGAVLYAMQHVPNLHLAVAGDATGSPYPLLAKELGVSARVTFLNKTAEVALIMRSVDLFVFPSHYEAHPLVLMEALASGLPVIAASAIGMGEDFADACLWLKNPNDAQALAALLSELLGSPLKRQQLASAGRMRALQMGWPVTTQNYLNIYEEIFKFKQASG